MPDQPAVDDSERCQYPNKRCMNRRATKRVGGLHRLCTMHRDKANRNQKRWLEHRFETRTMRRSIDTEVVSVPVIDPTPLDLAMAALCEELLTAVGATVSPVGTAELRMDDTAIEFLGECLLVDDTHDA